MTPLNTSDLVLNQRPLESEFLKLSVTTTFYFKCWTNKSHLTWVFLQPRMCALLKSQRKDQQDYIKAKLAAGTPLWLTNRLLVWSPVFLPDQSARLCGYCCRLPPGLWLRVPFRDPPCSTTLPPLGRDGNPYFWRVFRRKQRKSCRNGKTHGGSSLLHCSETVLRLEQILSTAGCCFSDLW